MGAHDGGESWFLLMGRSWVLKMGDEEVVGACDRW